MNIEEKIERITEKMKPKRWNQAAENALRYLHDRNFTLKQKADIMAEIFPQWEWTEAVIASKERRV